MNRKAYIIVLAFVFLGISFLTGCSSGSGPGTVTIATTTGGAQSATVTTAYTTQFAATVMTGTSPTSGVSVTFTAPTSGASGTFANGTNTETDTTNSIGVATSSTFTANGTPGAFAVTAATSQATASANFSLTNTGGVYSYYLTGTESLNDGPNLYALAGSVVLDASGDLVANSTGIAGEQDYNDGLGLLSPQPSGDAIAPLAGALALTNGQGTLTLNTNNTALGVNGTETLGIQFVNNNHALITQFDGSATSSGSLDLQTLPSTLSGGYAFTLSGVDPNYYPAVLGGVFTVSPAVAPAIGFTFQGVYDENDTGAPTVTTGTAFPAGAAISAPDVFGRGSITGTGPNTPTTINYYIVGQEAIRLIDVDASDTAIGSAFGQGTTAGKFTNADLGSSVFGFESNSEGNLYAAAGQFISVPDSGTFSGVADEDEEGNPVSGATIEGTYSISSSGYGTPLTITSGDLGDISVLGVYMTDPNLNLNDPNNTTGGGGALVADLDSTIPGTGILIPQTDPAVADFAGNYAFGARDYFCNICEFDFVGQGTVTAGVFAGTGLLNDPVGRFGISAQDVGVVFGGTATPDPNNLGRYTIPLTVSVGNNSTPFTVVTYQASAGQLFLLDEDFFSLSLGSIEQQGSLSGLAEVRKAAVKTKTKHKQ